MESIGSRTSVLELDWFYTRNTRQVRSAATPKSVHRAGRAVRFGSWEGSGPADGDFRGCGFGSRSDGTELPVRKHPADHQDHERQQQRWCLRTGDSLCGRCKNPNRQPGVHQRSCQNQCPRVGSACDALDQGTPSVGHGQSGTRSRSKSGTQDDRRR